MVVEDEERLQSQQANSPNTSKSQPALTEAQIARRARQKEKQKEKRAAKKAGGQQQDAQPASPEIPATVGKVNSTRSSPEVKKAQLPVTAPPQLPTTVEPSSKEAQQMVKPAQTTPSKPLASTSKTPQPVMTATHGRTASLVEQAGAVSGGEETDSSHSDWRAGRSSSRGRGFPFYGGRGGRGGFPHAGRCGLARGGGHPHLGSRFDQLRGATHNVPHHPATRSGPMSGWSSTASSTRTGTPAPSEGSAAVGSQAGDRWATGTPPPTMPRADREAADRKKAEAMSAGQSVANSEVSHSVAPSTTITTAPSSPITSVKPVPSGHSEPVSPSLRFGSVEMSGDLSADVHLVKDRRAEASQLVAHQQSVQTPDQDEQSPVVVRLPGQKQPVVAEHNDASISTSAAEVNDKPAASTSNVPGLQMLTLPMALPLGLALDGKGHVWDIRDSNSRSIGLWSSPTVQACLRSGTPPVREVMPPAPAVPHHRLPDAPLPASAAKAVAFQPATTPATFHHPSSYGFDPFASSVSRRNSLFGASMPFDPSLPIEPPQQYQPSVHYGNGEPQSATSEHSDHHYPYYQHDMAHHGYPGGYPPAEMGGYWVPPSGSRLADNHQRHEPSTGVEDAYVFYPQGPPPQQHYGQYPQHHPHPHHHPRGAPPTYPPPGSYQYTQHQQQ